MHAPIVMLTAALAAVLARTVALPVDHYAPPEPHVSTPQTPQVARCERADGSCGALRR